MLLMMPISFQGYCVNLNLHLNIIDAGIELRSFDYRAIEFIDKPHSY